MSLKSKAANVALAQARKARQQATDAHEKVRRAAEEKVREITGVPGVYVKDVQVARLHENYDRFAGSSKRVEYDTWMLIRVDDIDLLAQRKPDSYIRDPKVMVTLGMEDPEHGWYQASDYGQEFYGTHKDDSTDAEREAKFVAELANRISNAKEHPIVRLRKLNETCPSCGRAY